MSESSGVRDDCTHSLSCTEHFNVCRIVEYEAPETGRMEIGRVDVPFGIPTLHTFIYAHTYDMKERNEKKNTIASTTSFAAGNKFK